MADLSSVGVSVLVTLTLQSAYLVVVRFPRTFRTEQIALLSTTRQFTAGMSEGNYASAIAAEATDLLTSANDCLTGEPDTCGREQILQALTIVAAKLTGFSSSCKEPEATHLRTVLSGVSRTVDLLTQDKSPDERKREMLSIAYTNKLSLKAASLKLNEARAAVANEIEQRSSNISISLIEFYGACIFAYVGLIAIAAAALHQAVHLALMRPWIAWVIGLLLFLILNFFMGRMKSVADAAKSVVKSSEEQVKFTRDHLLELS